MVKIKKTALPRHEVTLSPAVSDFAKATASIPLYQIPKHLASFPRRWPFPRGDLYHWIPALNRFDQILQVFSDEYGLSKGPQNESFSRRVLLKGEGSEYSPSASLPDNDTLDKIGFSEDGDRELIEGILVFTRLLLENCGNRNLYASSSHLNCLLNTTSLSLLKVALKLSLRLAQRYYATRQRMPSTSSHNSILSSHYAINLDNVHKLASTFAKTPLGSVAPQTIVGKGKEKLSNASDEESRPKWTSGDLMGIATDENGDERSNVRLSFYDTNAKPVQSPEPVPDMPQSPSTPIPARRSSNLSQQQYPPATPEIDPPVKSGLGHSTGPKVFEISATKLQSTPIHDLVNDAVKNVPEDYQYETLHRIRVASALASNRSDREAIVAVRLLAIANLAYVYSESTFQSKISQPDFDEPRRFQLPYQLSELIHPPRNSDMEVSVTLQALAITTLEALTKHKMRSGDVVAALSVNVNHGVLFYVVRKMVAGLASEDGLDENQDEEYRDAIFALLNSLPMCQPRTGEALVSAGLLEVLVEILGLRTSKAEWNYPKVLGFLDSFLFSIRDAFQSLVNAKGLDSIADLTSFQVDSAFSNVQQGKTMPPEYKTKLTDYKIQWHQQQNLRWLVKLTNRMLTHANANFERLLRNLIDSPQLLRALRTILEHAKIFGSTVWSTAVAILTNFIHNEPTSYAVIAEAGLSHAFLEAVIQRPLPQISTSNIASSNPVSPVEGNALSSTQTATPKEGLAERINKSPSEWLAPGILPSVDAMSQIPPGFGAICLNEAGMKLFKESDAMRSFFEVFESPVHVKAMDQEQDMAGAIGQSFDELVRHHPILKSEIADAISVMIGRVGKLCFARASERGTGAKLWLEDDSGSLHVAGGREALRGEGNPYSKRLPQATSALRSVDDDVDMDDAEPPDAESSSAHVSIDEILESEDKKDAPTTSQYIGAVCRFLIGFFSGSNSILAFAEGEGLELLIDFATMPSLPYNVSEDSWGSSIEELARVLQPLIEQKPHLILPQLINRAQRAVDILEPLVDHTGDAAFFSPFTTGMSKSTATKNGLLERTTNGTKYAKSLVSVQSLCTILCYAFQNQFFSQRSNHNIFSQVNLADLYARLIDNLGRLHRSCVWEEVLLQRSMPREWEKSTRVKSGGMNSEELDSLLDMGRTQPLDPVSSVGTGAEAADAQSPEIEQETAVATVVKESATAKFKNTRTLRFLLCRVPTAITPFLQSLGKLLLFRRSSHHYPLQCAYVVADQIAKASIDQLLFTPPKESVSTKDRYPYWITILTSISRVMIDDSMERGFPQTITLILLCFKDQGGFDALQHILESFIREASTIASRPDPEGSSLSSEEQGLLDLSLGGIRIILNFYSQIVNSKIVGEATQTAALNRPERERHLHDFFCIGQFVVELRLTVMRPVLTLWQSELMENCTVPIVKSLVDTLKVVLEAEGETAAFKRSEKPPSRAKVPIKAWKIRSEENVKKLTDSTKVDESLAREALYRCNDSLSAAQEYCRAFTRSARPTRNPLPAYETEIIQATGQSSVAAEASNSSTAEPSESTETASEEEELNRSMTMEDVSSLQSSGDEIHPERTSTVGGASHVTFSGPSYFKRSATSDTSTSIITLEDLDEQRNELRTILIDRSLEVLNAHEDVTFDLSDMINAAVLKAQDPATLRREIGQTLVQSLISLQVDDDLRPNAKQIAATAHLLGLTLQDRPFYEATLEELQGNFEALLSFVRISPNQGGKDEETSPWVGPVLLLLELLLSDDARPRQIQWTPPSGEDLPLDRHVAEEPKVVVQSQKIALFKTITEILPYVGKDDVLALAVSRILVILTRQRDIATLLSQKRNIQRLFLMVRQLGGITNQKLQNAFLIILRHMVEDDEVIRQIMRSEIQHAFESRDGRQKDTTGYTRQMYHLALRNPDIFVEVTGEKLMLPRWEPSQRPQNLALKHVEKAPAEATTEKGKDGAPPSEDVDGKGSGTDGKRPDKLERAKTQELRCPVVENPDGVIHYLLCELLAYKEVEDKPAAATSDVPADGPASTDIEMSGNEESSPSSTPSLTETKKSEKQDFKADQHPFFIYRCFILQCLTELLSSYNRAKIEFINFSRKADPHASTPSKPRSGILNYLLNNLVPVSSLGHSEDTASRKQAATSNWAMLAIVGLCAKAGREPTDGISDTEEDTELLYVRRFVLEHALKSFKDATASLEPLDSKYARLMVLAELFNRMINGSKTVDPHNPGPSRQLSSQKQLSKIMYEKNFIGALTSAIADVDLNFPNAERAVKHILKTLRTLTSTGVEVSTSPATTTNVVEFEDDDIASNSSSLSDVDGREATPDLFRNSTLGLLDPSRQDEYESESEDDEEDEDNEMDDGYYEDEMEFEEDNPHGNEDAISDPEDDIEGVGPIEGLSGDIAEVELTIDEGDSEMDDDEDDEDDESDDEHDDDDDEDMNDIMDHVEIIAEEDDGSSGASDEEDDWENEDTGEDYHGQDEVEDDVNVVLPPLDNLIALENADDHALIQTFRDRGAQGAYVLESEMVEEEDDEDDDEDDEDAEMAYEEGDEFLYGAHYDDEDDDEGTAWRWDDPPPPMRGHHHHHHTHHAHTHAHPHRLHSWMGTDRGLLAYRSHRPGPNRAMDDGANPLLQRSGRTPVAPQVRHMPMNDFFHSLDPLQPGRFMAGDGPVSFISNLINAIGHGGPTVTAHNGNIHLSFGSRMDQLPPLPGSFETSLRRDIRGSRDVSGARSSRETPNDAVAFAANNTLTRWIDESRMLYGVSTADISQRLINSILKLLVPPAMEVARQKAKEFAERQARKAKEDAEAKENAEKERAEREAKEQKEHKEREAAEAEARARQQAEAGHDSTTETGTANHMEGVEVTEQAVDSNEPPSTETEAQARVTTSIRGREIDITNLGIDVEYLEALPDELREEVLMQRVAEQRSEAVAAGETPTDISPEFLDALPADIREEILQSEAQDRRRREREEARRRGNASGTAPAPRAAEEMDPASFLASLDPGLRQTVLMDQDEEILGQLPPEIAAEARALGGDRHLNQFNDGHHRAARPRTLNVPSSEQTQKKAKPRPAAQMLDKAGIATLLRLMFIPQEKRYLNETLKNVCQNRQNRAEVISILLSILQDGSADVNAVERSFAQLSIRAKQPGLQKTPQPKRALASQTPSHSELSPLMVVHQCLTTLSFLADKDGHIPSFFLSEHETAAALKAKTPRKGKNKESKVSRFPLNALLGLLDRKIIIESSMVMEQLAALLSKITVPLQVLLKRETGKSEETPAAGSNGEGPIASTANVIVSQTAETPSASTTTAPASTNTEASAAAAPSVTAQVDPTKAKETSDESSKKPKALTPPEVPDYNLRLVVNILAARECSSKTFRDSLSVISYLSAIPGAKEVFGQALVQQAQELGQSILNDLAELVVHILKAQTGADVQGLALANFSPASSDQAKLLRVLTALDYLFDPKRADAQDKSSHNASEDLSTTQKEDILTTLYENSTFASLWSKLSECLTAIRQRENMFNVATILLPLIEILMIVCKNTSLKDTITTKSQQKDFALSSPPPESRMENLFFTFTEDHRKVLNDLVRHNPKLMSGSFSLLVKNSKVLEFDNKRNYFTRRLHSRTETTRQAHQPLQLSVRREQVFLDSFRSLYFKSAEEMKFGKLNIRFHGEEGVDAGGVTREWFQVLARQMFDANYALFVPVASDRTTFHPNRLSSVNAEHLTFFKFIGRIIGKALYEGRVLDCHFSRAVYKRILGKPVSIKDMESLDVEYYKSLLWMLENDIADIITETFSTETDDFGNAQTIDLIENGRNIPVTEENKHEYVRLVVEYKLTGSVQEQLASFLKGFHDIIPAELIAIFNEQELELLISGLPDIDVDDWKNNTDYHSYTAAAPQVQWFWRAVRSFDKEERAKLLQFVTGTSKVPLNGFKELEGMNGFNKFNIHRDPGNKDRLPSSHTCFNQLDLPEYVSYEKLREQLYTAMTAGSEYFGFA